MKSALQPVDCFSLSPQPVAGVDEAGRGSLAGPVFAGAVILRFPGKFQDSKLLQPRRREELAETIKKNHIFGLGSAGVWEIDKLNIHHASLLAMRRAVEAAMKKAAKILGSRTALLLIDGQFAINGLPGFPQRPLVKGDRRAASIMAASIMAKTERDRLMVSLGREYPEYGFERHKGYGTRQHLEAIKKLGPCPLHRKTFAPARGHLRQASLWQP